MRKIFQTLLTLALLAVPRMALACPVCFGNSDAPMAKATNLGIIAMLVVVAGVLASFAAFFIYLNRRARMVGQSHQTEGTVQC
jgi:hypothetical protein